MPDHKYSSIIKSYLFKVFGIMLASMLIIMIACSGSTDASGNAPSDHTISKDGVMHKPGLNNALENCVSCHGSDLKGGSAGVSCYQCHGKKWSG